MKTEVNLKRTFSAMLFLFAIAFLTTLAIAQGDDEARLKVGEIKAGDRVEADPTSSKKWSTCTVIKVNLTYNGDIANFSIRCDTAPYSSVMPYSGHIHILTQEQKEKPGAAGANDQDIPAPNNGQPNTNKNVNEFGTRNPTTCTDYKAPGNGAMTAVLAKKYFMCQEEGLNRTDMVIYENVKVEVSGGRRYNPAGDYLYSNIDATAPIYPIRGSFTEYRCAKTDTSDRWYNIGKNCSSFTNRNAEGSCYKSSFGDWRCHMNDAMKTQDDKHFQVAPPK